MLFIVCVAFAALGVLMVRDGAFAGYFVASVFGLGALVAAVNLHPRSSYLELTDDGFTVCSLFRRSFVPWHHVAAFVPIRMHGNAMVGWDYTAASPARTTARRASVALAGVEAALPDTYGMKAAQLSAVMNLLAARSVRGRRVGRAARIAMTPVDAAHAMSSDDVDDAGVRYRRPCTRTSPRRQRAIPLVTHEPNAPAER